MYFCNEVKKIGNIEIRVTGNSGNQKLTPENYDIKYIISLLKDVEDWLYPNNKKDRPVIAYNIQEGSVKHIFTTTMQAIIGFSAILSQIKANNTIDFLDIKTARAFENIQNLSIQKNYFFQIKTSLSDDYELDITPQTKFFRTENLWVDAEFYFYGTLVNAGGKNKANIHLDTADFGIITIDTRKDFLEEQEQNLLYKKYGVRVSGKQNIETGEVDTKSLKLIELINYEQKFNDEYLTRLIKKAKKNWKGINPDEWLKNLRGGYEA